MCRALSIRNCAHLQMLEIAMPLLARERTRSICRIVSTLAPTQCGQSHSYSRRIPQNVAPSSKINGKDRDRVLSVANLVSSWTTSLNFAPINIALEILRSGLSTHDAFSATNRKARQDLANRPNTRGSDLSD
jgi:hypothetical protein